VDHPTISGLYYLQITLTLLKQIILPKGFSSYINTKTEYNSIAEKDVDIPDYFSNVTPNPMTGTSNKSIKIPYGLNIGLINIQLSIYDDYKSKNITISNSLRLESNSFNLRMCKPDVEIGRNVEDKIYFPYELNNNIRRMFRRIPGM
jgi:hypothetical protein